MKKEDLSTLIVYILILGAAIIFGFAVLQNYAKSADLSTGLYVFFIIGAILVGVIFNAIIFELGHMLGAKIGRYKIISVNVLGFCWTKNYEEKWKFRFSDFDGLTGCTKIRPDPDAKKTPNPYPYLLFGPLFYAIELILTIVLFVVMQKITNDLGTTAPAYYLNTAYFFVTVAFIGALGILYNILPFHMEPINDGYRLVLVSNPKNKEAFNELLRVEYEISCGNKDVEIKTFDTITNFTADLNLNKVYALFDQEKFEEAEVILNKIIESKKNVSEKVYVRALAQIVYIHIIKNPIEKAREEFDKIDVSDRKLISLDDSMVCLRTCILIEALFEKSKSECLIALRKVQKAYKKTPKKRQASEVALFNKAIKIVCEAHPKWEFENYYLKEDNEAKK